MIILASDHAGFPLKEEIKKFFNKENIIAIDVGCYSREQLDDYPDFAKAGNAKVLEDSRNVGIYICGTGIGMSIVANKFKGIRCAKCDNEEEAKFSRMHNDSNVLALGADYIGTNEAIRIVRMWIATEFEGGRHAERIQIINEIENENMK